MTFMLHYVYAYIIMTKIMQIYLPSLSIIVTVALSGLPTVTPVGSEDGSIVSVKFSLFSMIASSCIVILNGKTVIPEGKVTVYGPET